MIALISALVVLSVSILITRIATVALTHTGLSQEVAQFQARSAFTGVGFTTNEAERIPGHPVRRRIVMLLMLLGNVGIVSILASVLLTIVEEKGSFGVAVEYRILFLLVGIASLVYLSHSAWFDRWLSGIINRALDRWTDVDVRDYVALLRLADGYQIRDMRVRENDWLADRRLEELGLREEGINVLGIVRDDGSYVGTPRGQTTVSVGDTLVFYARVDSANEIDRRLRGAIGDADHERAVAEQERHQLEEDVRDRARKTG